MSRRSSRPRYVLLVLVLASISVITLSFRGGSTGWLSGVRSAAADVFTPIQSAAGTVFGPVGRFFEGAASYGSVKAANAKLGDQIAALKGSNSKDSVIESQMAAIAAEEHLSFAPAITDVVTQVVANSASNFQDSIQLSKGTGAGIRIGMPAVTGGGLVGTVVQVSSDRCTVQLITDPATKVGVSFGATGQQAGLALANGQGSDEPLSVGLIFPGTKLFKGELMVTSGGAGDLYPFDIPVGTVANASLAPAASQETVTLKPSVNFAGLQFVGVLLFKPSSAP
ncbi:MAG: rod shape-determining protein MreC [Acidimicrobiales bacterium]